MPPRQHTLSLAWQDEFQLLKKQGWFIDLASTAERDHTEKAAQLVAGANKNEGIRHEQRNQYRSQKGD